MSYAWHIGLDVAQPTGNPAGIFAQIQIQKTKRALVQTLYTDQGFAFLYRLTLDILLGLHMKGK